MDPSAHVKDPVSARTSYNKEVSMCPRPSAYMADAFNH